MNKKLQIENCKMKIENWRKRLLLPALGFCVLCFFAGCPEQAHIKVTVKPVAGASDALVGGAAPVEATAAGYGSLVGTVTYDGTPKDLPPLVPKDDSTLKPEDKATCAATAVPDESLIVNSPGNGLANVVIFLEKKPGNIKPELAKPPTEPVIFDQKGCRFLPHVLVVRVGQPLMVLNADKIPHNTHTKPSRNPEFNQLVPAEERNGVSCNYKKPESGPISVGCDLHKWMKAYHFPVDHPYAAVTDKDGNFKIEGLPAGKHLFNVWHELGPGDARLLKRKLQITIEVDKEATQNLTFGPTDFAAGR